MLIIKTRDGFVSNVNQPVSINLFFTLTVRYQTHFNNTVILLHFYLSRTAVRSARIPFHKTPRRGNTSAAPHLRTPFPRNLNNWRTLILNQNGIACKKATFANLVDYIKPDPILITECDFVAEGLENGDSRPFWKHVISQREDTMGVPLLKKNGPLYMDIRTKPASF